MKIGDLNSPIGMHTAMHHESKNIQVKIECSSTLALHWVYPNPRERDLDGHLLQVETR